ncbi:BURP domain-containing protein 9-like isoform X2 [Hordeum vulgare subsp. vulgare]|uniref:BURP domain-containing protein n=1 Tax=Hordeum vulgare subsp. vulgare TaxID=112509 RepID=A0A8I6YE28_HORVV|nr:BURP domain-containing protein 9-like isoform X2 [Hordeum vulgare subsp. vulgare]
MPSWFASHHHSHWPSWMQRTAPQRALTMDLLLPLVSLLLITGGGGHHVSFVDAATANSATPRAYWEAVLPGTPMPPAVSDLLAQREDVNSVRALLDDVNLKLIKGLRKIGPYYKKIKSEADRGAGHSHIASEAGYDLKEVSVSYGSKGGDNLKEVSVSYGSKDRESIKEVRMSYGVDDKDVPKRGFMAREGNIKDVSVSYGSKGGENLKEVSVSYGIEGKDVSKRGSIAQEGNLKEVSVSYGSDEGKDKHIEVLNQGEEDPHRVTMLYGAEQEDDPNKATMTYGSEQEEDPHKVTMSHEANHEDDPNKATMTYGLEQEDDPHKVTMSYGANHEDDPNKATMTYGSEQEDDPHKVTMSYRANQEVDPNKVTSSYGPGHEEYTNRITLSDVSEHEDDPNKATMSYGSKDEVDPNKATMSYKLKHGNDLKTVSTGHKTHIEGEASHHVPSHSHKNKRHADVFFFRDMLRPGSMIIPTIPPTTSLPTLLPRHIADSLPFSTKRLSDIIAMFAPTSLTMTRDIRWTLDTCEHPRTLPGEEAGCAASLESLAALATSLLGTSNVRAFSAADLPVEAPGTPALRGKFNVTAARRLSESPEIVTCHDLTYPYAVYYCHTSNPTAAYAVTLESVEGGTAPASMEALAVCHLDTTQWSPEHPFFALHSVKPGDVAVCHFLTKLSIVWVRASESGDAHVAGR